MKWKKFPYWFRGGIIGLIISLTAFMGIYSLVFLINSPDNPSILEIIFTRLIMYLGLFISLTIGLPIMITQFLVCFKNSCPQATMIHIIWFFTYIIIGIIIGFIVGKIKAKK